MCMWMASDWVLTKIRIRVRFTGRTRVCLRLRTNNENIFEKVSEIPHLVASCT